MSEVGHSAGAPTAIVWPLWQRVTFTWPGQLVVLFREGHASHGQHAYHHHRSYHAENRHITVHLNPTSLCGGIVLCLW